MSKAFTREDVDPPERSGRLRTASGLPPGAVNYISARGAQRLRNELHEARAAGDADRASELEQILSMVTIVEPPAPGSNEIVFGATVTLELPTGERQTFTVVGVEELRFETDAVSWVSPIGKAILAAEAGERITVQDQRLGKIVMVEYRKA